MFAQIWPSRRYLLRFLALYTAIALLAAAGTLAAVAVIAHPAAAALFIGGLALGDIGRRYRDRHPHWREGIAAWMPRRHTV